jgi:hypothetical protein
MPQAFLYLFDNPQPIDVTGDAQSSVQRDPSVPMNIINNVDDVGYNDAGIISDSRDNDYDPTVEQDYVVLDEENERAVGSRNGAANFTQNVDAAAPEGYHDDADIREGELPIQDFTYGNTEPQDVPLGDSILPDDQPIRNTDQS